MIIIVATAALVAAALPGGSAHADTIYPILWQFRNANSNKCLDVLWHSNDNGDPAIQTPCSPWTGRIQPRGDAGTYLWDYEFLPSVQEADDVRALHLGHHGHLCLEVADYSTENFAPIDVHDCNGGPHQQWRIIMSGYNGTSRMAQWLGPAFELQNVWSGKCLEVYQYSLSDVAFMDQYDCYKGLNQLWFEEAGNA